MSIKIIQTPYIREEYYTMNFWFDSSSCYSFQCSEKGIVLESKNTPEALKNYSWCLKNMNKFIHHGVEKHTLICGGQRIGYCKCGCEFDVYNQYLGTCECPNCRQWYNLIGEEVLAPYQYDADEG